MNVPMLNNNNIRVILRSIILSVIFMVRCI